MDSSQPTRVSSQNALRIASGLLAIDGLAMMIYLAHVHFAPAGASTFCDFAPGFSCEIVNKSAFSEILGVPMALLGVAYFLAMLGAALCWKDLRVRRAALIFTAFSLVFGLYLSWVEISLLGTICLFCELSKVDMAALAALLMLSLRQEKENIPWRDLALGGAGGLALAALAYFSRL